MGGLYDKICRLDSLMSAWQKVREKGAAGGIDNISVGVFERNIEANLKNLSYLLSAKRYIPEPYKEIKVPKGDGEHRYLGLPTIRDKIVQQAIKDVIEPIFEKEFLDVSYGYRPHKGPLKAINRVFHLLTNEKRGWVTICDIDNYFDEIRHDILFPLLAEKIDDKELLCLIRLEVKMGRVDRRLRWKDTIKGVPQGSIISPLLSNLYLHPLDKMMVERRFGYVRYADDFIILSHSEPQAYRALKDTVWFLEKKLRLRINPGSEVREVKEGFEFLGIFFKGTEKGLSEKKMAELKEKISSALSESKDKSLTKLYETLKGIGQYYGALLPSPLLEELDEWTVDHLKENLKRAYQEGLFRKKGDIQRALSDIPFLSENYQLFRNRVIKSIVAFCRRERKVKARAMAPYKGDLIRRKKRVYQRLESAGFELLINRPGVFLGKTKRGVSVKERGVKLYEAPFINLKHISILSHGVTISSNVVFWCAERKIPIDFIGIDGRPYAKLFQPTFPSASLGIAQLNAYQNGKAIVLAKKFVLGKIKNQINLLKYYHKYRKNWDKDFVELFQERIRHMESLAREATNIYEAGMETLRGRLFSIEGRVASHYWDLIETMLSDYVVFEGRVRKGATDLLNSLLNYGYGILYSRIWDAVLLAELNPYISYLHKPQRGKPTLVFDLIEEFRQQAVDRPVFSLITKGEELKIEKGLLTAETKKRLVERILERINTVETFRGRQMRLYEIMNGQARAIATFLEGKSDQYRPYIGRW